MQCKIRNIFLIALLVIFVSCITGCYSASTPPMTNAEAYTAAVDQLYGNDFTVKITAVQTMKHGSQQLTETTVKDVFYNDFGTNKMRTSMHTTVTLNESSFSYSEIYVDGTSILDINGGSFTAVLTEEQSLTRYTMQCALLSPTFYEQIVHQYSDGRRIIGFSQPTQAEAWALPANADFVDSSGSAVLLSDGTLFESKYSIIYTYGTVTVAYTVTAHFDRQDNSTIALPSDENCISITDLDAPVLLETACARLLSTYAVTAQLSYDVTCEAGGLQRIQNTQTKLTGLRPNLDAQVDTTVELINLNQQGTVRSYTQTEVFSEGEYMIDSDSTTTQPANSVTEDTMRTYCKNNLVSSVMLPQYISNVEFTETPQGYLLSFTASEKLSQLLFSNAYQSLYNDQAAQEAISSYTTQSITGHIEIDRNTGLPISSGMSYEGTNTIDQSVYAFRVYVSQNYSYM